MEVLVESKIISNRLKAKVKRAIKQLDGENSGKIETKAFYSLLELVGGGQMTVEIGEKTKKELTERFSIDKEINYLAALKFIELVKNNEESTYEWKIRDILLTGDDSRSQSSLFRKT